MRNIDPIIKQIIPPMPMTPKPGVTNISMISSRHPIIIKIMLNVESANPEPMSASRIAITPNTSAPYPGDEMPKINAKIQSIKRSEVSIGFEIILRICILKEGK